MRRGGFGEFRDGGGEEREDGGRGLRKRGC